jgi:hypothetical protein
MYFRLSIKYIQSVETTIIFWSSTFPLVDSPVETASSAAPPPPQLYVISTPRGAVGFQYKVRIHCMCFSVYP